MIIVFVLHEAHGIRNEPFGTCSHMRRGLPCFYVTATCHFNNPPSKVRRAQQLSFDEGLEKPSASHRGFRLNYLRRTNTLKHSGIDPEEGLIPLAARRYTFSYETTQAPSGEANADHSKRNASLLDTRIAFSTFEPRTGPLEFGTAFEFSPETELATDERERVRKKRKRKENLTDDDIPPAYQSIFTYESAFHDGEFLQHVKRSKDFPVSTVKI